MVPNLSVMWKPFNGSPYITLIEEELDWTWTRWSRGKDSWRHKTLSLIQLLPDLMERVSQTFYLYLLFVLLIVIHDLVLGVSLGVGLRFVQPNLVVISNTDQRKYSHRFIKQYCINSLLLFPQSLQTYKSK